MATIRARITAVLAALALAGGGAAAVAIPAQAATCTTSAQSGACGPYSDPAIAPSGSEYVVQDVWNPVSGWKQTLTADGMGSWHVDANMPNGNTAVVSYPDSQTTYSTAADQPAPMSGFGTGLVSTYAQADPAGSGLDYEWAYDVWLGDTTRQSWTSDQEIMIWTDNHGQRPAGTDTGTVYTDPAGQAWEVWTASGSTTVGNTAIVTLARIGNATSGTAYLGDIFAWLKAKGYTSSSAGVDQIGYGAELCSTGGVTQTFTLTGFTIGQGGSPSPSPTATSPSPSPTSPSPSPTATSPSPSPSGTVVLNDKTFEGGGLASMQNWYGEAVSNTTTQAHGGTHSLKIAASSQWWGVQEAWPGQAHVTPGVADTFTGWLKRGSGSDSSLTVEIHWVDAMSGEVGSEQDIPASDNATGWTQFSGRFTPPPGAATAWLTITGSSGGTHYLDDLEVTQP